MNHVPATTTITVCYANSSSFHFLKNTVDTHSRGYGYSPPRRGHSQQFSSRRPPPDPHTFDYPANLRQYAEWFRYFFPHQATDEDNADKAAEQEAGDGSKPRNGIRSKWEKYKKDFSANQVSLGSAFHTYLRCVFVCSRLLQPGSHFTLSSIQPRVRNAEISSFVS